MSWLTILSRNQNACEVDPVLSYLWQGVWFGRKEFGLSANNSNVFYGIRQNHAAWGLDYSIDARSEQFSLLPLAVGHRQRVSHRLRGVTTWVPSCSE